MGLIDEEETKFKKQLNDFVSGQTEIPVPAIPNVE